MNFPGTTESELATMLPEWFVMRRVRPGEPDYALARASMPDEACDGTWDVFMLFDPAGETMGAKSGMAVTGRTVGGDAMELYVPPSLGGDLLVRLLRGIADSLRVDGLRRAVIDARSESDTVVRALLDLGYHAEDGRLQLIL
jgi:hypothetical protein